jgi:hypothetical protein
MKLQVRLRYEDDEDARPLCEIDPEQMEWIVREVGQWDCYHNGETQFDTSGQLVLNDSEAYFEVILHPREP